MRTLFIALLGLLASVPLEAKEKPQTTYTIPVPPKPDFSAFDWWIGEWTGKATGRRAQGEVHLTVAYALDKRFIILHEETSLGATQTAPLTTESWMGILSGKGDRSGFVLRIYSSHGFISLYGVSVDADDIHFNPEGGEQVPPGWLFRREVHHSGDSECTETVQVAPPHQAFFDYYTARLARSKAH